MNRYAALGCLGLGLIVSPLLGHFANSAVPANPKIGIIDIERALSETATGKKANAQFEATIKARQDDVDKRQAELRKMAADLDKQRAVLKPDALQQKSLEFQKKVEELKAFAAKQEQDLASDRAKLMQDVLAKAQPLIAEVAKAEGVQVILEHSAVVWAEPTLDLTKQLEAKM